MSEHEIIIKRAEDDSDYDWIFRIRQEVFVEEQAVPEEIEYDGNDFISNLYLAFYRGNPCGTARWRVTPFGQVKLERFAILPEYREKGVGMALAEVVTREMAKGFPVFLHAQESAVGFWEKVGFEKEGESFLEADIVHYKMVWKA